MANKKHLAILKKGVEAWNEWRGENPEILPDLGDVYLSGADLSYADLSSANLGDADLISTNLRGANLRNAHLGDADIFSANLSDANLSGAELDYANFSRVTLQNTVFTNTTMYSTIFAGTDLSVAIGLESVEHGGPSEISISTLYKSGGNIPESFLRGCGVPDDFIAFIPSHFGVQQAIQFYSCFISYECAN